MKDRPGSAGWPAREVVLQEASIRWYEATLIVALAALALVWPALVNGGPFWFPDTSSYIRGADAAVVTITGQSSEWSDRLVRVDPTAQASDPEAGTGPGNIAAGKGKVAPAKPVITGRSIYFGFVLYAPMIILGSWGAIYVQALLVAGLITVCLSIVAREFRLRRRVLLPTVFSLLAALTPLPYFTSMLMPDVYSGIIVLTLVTAICFWDGMSARERVLLVGASAVIATFHTTHVLIVLATAGAAALLFFHGRNRLRPLLIATPVLLAAFLAGAAFSYGVKSQLGEGPLSPPFLSARITASGPGTEYLRQHCTGAAEDFALCAFRDRLPTDSDTILWSKDPVQGVFQVAGPELQRRLGKEDRAFFLAVLRTDPVGFLGVTGQSVFETLTSFNLRSFNYSQGKGAALAAQVPASVADEIVGSRAFDQRMPTSFAVYAAIATTLASLAAIGWFSWASLGRSDPTQRLLRRYALLVVLAVLANGVACGALSKATARYQMRLIWLLPAAAMVVAAAGISRRPLEVGRPASG